ncbi:MAG: tRNA pseudouridine(13) synthase TruD [Gemmataceae bacterium]|nr:tRNA pseudouridine(13) synthase TruD [Gemmataceae bacterium]
MSAELFSPPPLLTADLPGVGGRIKAAPEDFEVEEIPAYEPSGSGDFLYLWVEKRGMGADYFSRQVARRLGIPPPEVGMAGLKDRHAVTSQWISVPASVEGRLTDLEGDGIRVLQVSRHGNKLKAGHLRGNRFRILVRDADPAASECLPPILDQIRGHGLPNYYGPQRFGRDFETLKLGLALLRNEPPPPTSGRPQNLRSPFLRKLVLSAAQSGLFNAYLARRFRDGLLRRVLPGDVMAKWPFGGMFVATDIPREQARFDARETVSAGPIFGKKTFAAEGEAAARELAVLGDSGLTAGSFAGFGKLVQGTRRHNLVYVDDVTAAVEPEGVRLAFTLPAGSYATVLLREVMKTGAADADEEP